MRELIDFLCSSPDGALILGFLLTFLCLEAIDALRVFFRFRAKGNCSRCGDFLCPARGCIRKFGCSSSSDCEVS